MQDAVIPGNTKDNRRVLSGRVWHTPALWPAVWIINLVQLYDPSAIICPDRLFRPHSKVPFIKELRSCTACGEPISDKFLLDVGGCSWHSACLRCCICHTPLDHQPSCFLRERQIYCKTDYTK
uniref:LIM zinc-binding domain-containing protein n=1 Tax=Anopheles maculatus TaxID=74869 RepID=A0A182T8C4_9DIPT